jgi:serine protease Do
MRALPFNISPSPSRRWALAGGVSLVIAALAAAQLDAQGPPPRRGDRPPGGFDGGGLDDRGQLEEEGEDEGGKGEDEGFYEGGGDDGLPFDTDRLFVPRWRLTDGPQVRAAFRDVVDDVRLATVIVHCDGKRRGLGGIVSPDGWILTKATPLCENVTVILTDGRQLPGVVVGENGRYDMALIKVTAQNLPTLNLTDATVPEVGSWLATVGMDRDPVAVGVVSVGPREIPPQAGVLGVQLDRTEANRPIVEQVFPGSAAEEAGIQVGDRIVRVDGVATPTRDELIERVRSFNPGDEVTLSVVREGRTITIQATLGGTFPGLEGRSEFQNNLGGTLSVRRFGFPVALQHDTVLRPEDCGGPVVDLDGRVIGFNIARAGRTESFAIPTSAVREVLDGLMTTGLAAVMEIEKEEADAAEADPTTGAAPETPPTPVLPADEAASAYADEGYQLVWSDEFNADGEPDPAKWTFERGFVRNEELQWYQPDNAVCDEGLLVIEGRREQVENPQFDASSRQWQEQREHAEFTSTSVLTRGLASWMYGRFEMRGRIDVRPGLWPAWWTLGDDGRWPAGGEIDVMEYYRGTLLANAAWADRRFRAKWDDSRTPLAELGDNWASDFHVWRMDWDEERIALSVDGRELNTVDLSETINETRDGDNPFHQPHYMILNLAIGGTNGGDPEETEFPARFEVDYVRVYQK